MVVSPTRKHWNYRNIDRPCNFSIVYSLSTSISSCIASGFNWWSSFIYNCIAYLGWMNNVLISVWVWLLQRKAGKIPFITSYVQQQTFIASEDETLGLVLKGLCWVIVAIDQWHVMDKTNYRRLLIVICSSIRVVHIFIFMKTYIWIGMISK